MDPVQLIQDCFGVTYRLHLLTRNDIPRHVKPKIFHDEVAARRFLRNMRVNEGFWRQLSHSITGRLPYSGTESESLEVVVRLVIQDKIRFTELHTASYLSYPIEKRTFKKSDGVTYQFVPPSEKLRNPSHTTKKFTSQEQAESFVGDLVSDEENIRAIADVARLSTTRTNIASIDDEGLVTRIGKAVFEEEILVFISTPHTPTAPKAILEDVFLETVPLAPPSEQKDNEIIEKFFFSV